MGINGGNLYGILIVMKLSVFILDKIFYIKASNNYCIYIFEYIIIINNIKFYIYIYIELLQNYQHFSNDKY